MNELWGIEFKHGSLITMDDRDHAHRALGVAQMSNGRWDGEEYATSFGSRLMKLRARHRNVYILKSQYLDIIAVDGLEGRQALRDVYPEFTIVPIRHSDYRWDFDYRK